MIYATRTVCPELFQKRETCQSPHQRVRPLQVSQQLSAISWQHMELSQRITRPVQLRALQHHETVRCVNSLPKRSRGRRLRFAYRLAERFDWHLLWEGLEHQLLSESCAAAKSHCYTVCSAKSWNLFDGLLVLGMGCPWIW